MKRSSPPRDWLWKPRSRRSRMFTLQRRGSGMMESLILATHEQCWGYRCRRRATARLKALWSGECSGIRAKWLGSRLITFKFRISDDFRFQILDFTFQISDFKFQTQSRKAY